MPTRRTPEPLCQKIGRRIEDLRTERDLSIGQLAFRSGGSKGHLSNVERGLVVPTALSMQKIAEGLGKRPFSLLLMPDEDPCDELVNNICELSPQQRRKVAAFVKRLARQGCFAPSRYAGMGYVAKVCRVTAGYVTDAGPASNVPGTEIASMGTSARRAMSAPGATTES